MKEDNFFRRIWNYYIKGEYHCDKCKYCRGGEYLMGCDDYDDAYCSCRKDHELQDTCRRIPNLIANLKANKFDYESSCQWDCWLDYGLDYENGERVAKEFIEEVNRNPWNSLSKFVNTFKAEDVEVAKSIDDCPYLAEVCGSIISEYEHIKGDRIKSPREKYKEAKKAYRKWWWESRIKCYFYKR